MYTGSSKQTKLVHLKPTHMLYNITHCYHTRKHLYGGDEINSLKIYHQHHADGDMHVPPLRV